MDTTNWVTMLNSTVKSLLQTNSSFFLSFGHAIAVGLALLLISRYGIATMLSGRGFDFGDFFHEVVLVIGICLTILKAYDTPLTILGKQPQKFPDVIIAGPQQLANSLNLDANKQLDLSFQKILSKNLLSLSPFDFLNLIQYWVLRSLIEITRGVMFAVTAFGLVAQAVLVLLGPVCIPFLLFQPLSFLFWGWLRSLLQYSFYPLVCACFSSVLSSFFVNLMKQNDDGAVSFAQSLALYPFFLVIILGMLAVPLVVSGLFSGSAGGGGSISRIFNF